MTVFKNAREWQTFTTGKKFVRSDTAAIYHFVNPMQHQGFNLKIVWRGKETLTKVEFHTMGNAIMKIEDEVFALKEVLLGNEQTPAGKDIIHTIFKGNEVQFVKL